MIKRQQNTNTFKSVTLSQYNDARDDINIHEYQFNRIPRAPGQAQKKEPTLTKFLYQFNSEHLQKLEQYVQQHKFLLKLPPPQKISLFEDALILCEYIKVRQGIKEDRVKTVEFISEQVARTLKRSKVTVKQRIAKKLSHCSVDEIMMAIKQNKPLNLDKKDKSKKNNTEREDSSKLHQAIMSKTINEYRNKVKKQMDARDDNFDIVSPKKQDCKVHPVKLYKYGKKALKEKIYIYVNKSTREVIKFPQSKLPEMKARINKAEPLPAALDFDSPIRAPRQTYTKEQKEDDISSQASFKSFKNRERQFLWSADKSGKELSPEKLTKIKTIQAQNIRISEQRDELYKVNNDIKLLEKIKSDPSLSIRYKWQLDEDKTLYNFQIYKKAEEIKCLMRYKSVETIIERANFLKLNWSREIFKKLDQIEAEMKVKEEEQDYWNVL